MTTDDASSDGELLGDIVATLSHDVRSPLSVADGQLSLLEEECDSERIDRIAAAHGRVDELVSDLVQLARTGRRVRSTEPVELGDVATKAWRTIDSRDAELTVTDSTRIVADPSCVCQLLENLFRNSVLHGGSSVRVRVGPLPTGNGFFVEDDGVGIPRDERSRIFEHEYTSADGGSGLGLTIVRQIADAHGWEISVPDGDLGGARFEISGVVRHPRGDQ